jgi:alpha-tubulin suppressor-like RCC1 family protein
MLLSVACNAVVVDPVGLGPVASCGDGTCGASEDALTCPQDCGTGGTGGHGATGGTGATGGAGGTAATGGTGGNYCGDGICDTGEDAVSCFDDCHCGNGLCNAGESHATCPTDCHCGSATCDSGEDAATCPVDCYCGNGTCDPGEDYATCAEDGCTCGNDTCDSGEDFTTCPQDGCPCGNGTCEQAEDQLSCATDCGAVAITAGTDATCVAIADGSARCVGSNLYGQLGDGTGASGHVPVQVAGLTGALVMAVGREHTCALQSDGTAWCWGSNAHGQLGNGTNSASPVPVQVPGLAPLADISAGGYQFDEGTTCAAAANGSAWCWGVNSRGELGHGTTTESNVPVLVTGLTDAVAISVGSNHVCAVKSDGTAWCWGSGGLLGDGATHQSCDPWGDCSPIPVQVSGLSDAVGIGVGYAHTCAVKTDGSAWCWGSNYVGELGTGTHTSSATPVQVSGLAGAKAISGGGQYTCALKTDGTVWCWGNNEWGELGDGLVHHDCSGEPPGMECSPIPVRVSGLTDAVAISAGSAHTCALKADGTAWCWGSNLHGQLGDDASHEQCSCGVPMPCDCSHTPVRVGLW